jgi:hypothetical protein
MEAPQKDDIKCFQVRSSDTHNSVSVSVACSRSATVVPAARAVRIAQARQLETVQSDAQQHTHDSTDSEITPVHISCCCDTPRSRPNVINAMPKINAVARVLVDKLAEHTAGGKGNIE